MIDRILGFSIRHRWFVVFGALLLAIWGARSAWRTPVDAIPDLSENQVVVFTEWAGHGPRELEDQISYPLALELKGLEGVRAVRSSSDVGFSMVSVIFEDGVGWEAGRRQVGEALARSSNRWPSGATPRLTPDAAATGQIFWYTVEGGGFDPGRLRAIQDWYVRPQLEAVPGVAEVAGVGGLSLEYRIELDPHRLRANGVTAGQIEEAIRKSNAAVGGDVIHKGNAEYVARGAGWLGARPGQAEPAPDPQRVLRDLENVTVVGGDGSAIPLANLAHIALGGAPRRGILEKDGGEATGGVALMKRGENPLRVTRRIRAKIRDLQPGLPPGVRIVPVYDRTPLIEGTIATVTDTLLEAILTASICILVVLRHARTAFLVAVTLPLSVLFSFGLMDVLRQLGVTIETNLMSLAGLAISIGVLVDSSIVLAENAMFRLKQKFGDAPVTGDTREVVLAACRQVGRPIAFSIAVMFISFLPVFALGGLEGKMFHPLAFAKSFALLGVGLLSITLVPALCTFFIRGRLKSEDQVAAVRGLMRIYRPTLDYLLDRPAGLLGFIGITFILGAAPLGIEGLLPVVVALAIGAGVWVARRRRTKWAIAISFVLIGLAAGRWMTPLNREFLTPLDEGMAMDMPITVPRMSAPQAADDLLARDMILCRFPEVEMVVGKAGRAETATDPAPLDMIETMVGFRPREFWPRRCLRPVDAEAHSLLVLDALVNAQIVRAPADRKGTSNAAAREAVALFDAQLREAAHQRNQEFERELGRSQARFAVERLLEKLRGNGSLSRANAAELAPRIDSVLLGHAAHLGMEPTPEAVAALVRDVLRKLAELGALEPGVNPLAPHPFFGIFGEGNATDEVFAAVRARHREQWRAYTGSLNAELLERASGLFTRLALESLLAKTEVLDPKVTAAMRDWQKVRSAAPPVHRAGGRHAHGGGAELPFLDPVPQLNAVQTECAKSFARSLLLWPRERAELAGFGGELDRSLQMPGWTNVWTSPIQNRVDMLSTGVNTTVGVRVLGRRMDDVVRASVEIAALLKSLPGAADVINDPIRGKGYLEVVPNRERMAKLGADPAAVTDLIEIALGGRIATTTVEGRERYPVRVLYARVHREDEETIRQLPVAVRSRTGVSHVPLSAIADVRIDDGPAAIKGENGLLRNYVRLNVRGRDPAEFVAAAQQAVAARVKLPDGVHVEWTGQFEQEARARRTLSLAIPAVVALIFLILWWTYRDLADALLMLLAVPGALAGGVILQWLLGYPLSVSAWVGFIACFGMATSTGIIMLVYLRQAVADAGGEANLTPEQLRMAVLNGAAHRLRPKLLTEVTTLFSLAPLLLATGTGAEVLRPMVVPVLGGLLIADEVIDLLLPVLFYRIRLRRLKTQPLPTPPPGATPA